MFEKKYYNKFNIDIKTWIILNSTQKKSLKEIEDYILNRIRKHENHTKTHTHSTNTYHYHFPKHLSIFLQQHRKKPEKNFRVRAFNFLANASSDSSTAQRTREKNIFTLKVVYQWKYQSLLSHTLLSINFFRCWPQTTGFFLMQKSSIFFWGLNFCTKELIDFHLKYIY
jgi:hypothetical protein